MIALEKLLISSFHLKKLIRVILTTWWKDLRLGELFLLCWAKTRPTLELFSSQLNILAEMAISGQGNTAAR
jgi:hypothetical protein